MGSFPENEFADRPRACCITVNPKCMSRCKMCYMWKENTVSPDFREIELEYWQKIVVLLHEFMGNSINICFTGGEPLISEKTLEIAKFASNRGLFTALVSNGYLINDEMARRINDSGVKEICLSVDSINEKTHDFLRGTKGAFRKVMDAIEYLCRHTQNLQIRINTIIMGINLEEIIDLTRWVIRDSRIAYLNFQVITQPFTAKPENSWYKTDEYKFLWPEDIKKMENVLDELIELKQKNTNKISNSVSQFKIYKSYFKEPQSFIKKTDCHIYKKVINIDAYGMLFFCYNFSPFGNIKEKNIDLKTLWYSQEAEVIRDRVKKCRSNCQYLINCYYDEKEAYINEN